MEHMNGPPAIEEYYQLYQWYKWLEVATPIIEFVLAGSLTIYLNLYQRP